LKIASPVTIDEIGVLRNPVVRGSSRPQHTS
jgi:hypothetical protein